MGFVFLHVVATWTFLSASVVVSQNANRGYYNSRSGGVYPGFSQQRYPPPQRPHGLYNYPRHPHNSHPAMHPSLRKVSSSKGPVCKLPNCYQAGMVGPRGLDLRDTPQIVFFTFDDAVNEDVFPYYTRLFTPDRTNPNGCPISATFFVSHEWTNYTMVKELYLSGHEIASHSITHRSPPDWWYDAPYSDWQYEMEGQRNHISQRASIPKAEIRGVRAPFLALGGNKQFQMMADFSFEYDATFMTGPHNEGGAWPFTLHQRPSVRYCSNRGCPNSSFPGVWEIPMNRWVGLNGEHCVMVDVCNQNSEEDTLAYLKKNFNRHYNGNRAPFGLNMHATWFKDSYKLDAMDRFIKELVAMDNVYIVTAHQVLEWMRAPQPLLTAREFPHWKTSCGPRGTRRLVRVLQPERADVRGQNPHKDQRSSISLSVSTVELPSTDSNVDIRGSNHFFKIGKKASSKAVTADDNVSSKRTAPRVGLDGTYVKQEKATPARGVASVDNKTKSTERQRKPTDNQLQVKNNVAFSSQVKSSSQELQKQDSEVNAAKDKSEANKLNKAAIALLVITAAVVVTLTEN